MNDHTQIQLSKSSEEKEQKIEEQESIPPVLQVADSFVGLPDVVERTECMYEDTWVQGVLHITHDDVIFEPEAGIKDMTEPQSQTKAPMSPPPGLKGHSDDVEDDSSHKKRHSSAARRGSVFGKMFKTIAQSLGIADSAKVMRMPFLELQELECDSECENIFMLHPRASGKSMRLRFESSSLAKRMQGLILMRRRVASTRERRVSTRNKNGNDFEDVTAEELGGKIVTRKDSLWGSKKDELRRLHCVYVYRKSGLFHHDWSYRILWHDVGQGWIRYSLPEDPSSSVQSEGWLAKGAMLQAIDPKSRHNLPISTRIDLFKQPIPGLRLECAISSDRHTSSTKMGTIKMICPGASNFLSLVRQFERARISLSGPLERMLVEYKDKSNELRELELKRNEKFTSWWPVIEWHSVWRRFDGVNAKMFLLEDISGPKFTNYPEPLAILQESFAAREALAAIRKIVSSVKDGELPTYEDLMSRIRVLFDVKILNSIDHATRSILRHARIMAMSKLEDTKKGIECRSTIWSAPSDVAYESFGHFEVSIVQNSSWNEIISVERRISQTSVKLARWKVANGYRQGSIHGESKLLMKNIGRTYENELRNSKHELLRKKTTDLEHSSSGVTRYRLVFDRRRKDDVRYTHMTHTIPHIAK